MIYSRTKPCDRVSRRKHQNCYRLIGFSLSLQGIKDFSNWPTIPQVFMNSEFVGGCDILLQMHQNGEFIEELEKIGIKSALLEKPEDDKKN